MMRGSAPMVLMTTIVSCLDGFEESQSDAMMSAGGAVSEKNRWRLDAGDNRSMKRCIIAWSSGRVARRNAVVPSRRMTGPDSKLPDSEGGWDNGLISFMLGHPFDLWPSMLRRRRSSCLFRAVPGGEDAQRELQAHEVSVHHDTLLLVIAAIAYINQSGFIIMTALNPTITSPLSSLSHRPSRS
jgi:hypothetical protein